MTNISIDSSLLHQDKPVLMAGKPLAEAKGAMICLHGRGATAADILSVATTLNRPEFAYLAPQAAGNTWYPYRFLEPLINNEPWLTSALQAVSDLLVSIHAGGIALERTFILGFSQGACLALEFGARNARRYGGLVGLSGGLIGPDDTPRDYPGSFDSTPVFLGCSDTDPHIPKVRVEESANVLARIGARVRMRIYPRMGHEVNADEIKMVMEMMDEAVR